MLQVNSVDYSYGKRKVLSDICFETENEIIGLMGVNGAGKSTLIKLLAALQSPQRGTISIEGRDIHENEREYLAKIGYMPQYAGYYGDYRVVEMLEYIGILKGLSSQKLKERISFALEYTNLFNESNKRMSALSGGMRQRFGIAQSIINDPQILILDEPTAGLDPIERIRFRQLIRDISKERTVLIATHIAEDIEALSDRVIILHEGSILEDRKIDKNLRGSIEKTFMGLLLNGKDFC